MAEKSDSKPEILNTGSKAICHHYGYLSGSIVQQYIQYACDISHNDRDFVLTLNSENGSRDPIKVGPTKDKGLCQISMVYHPEITNDPRFTDYKRQLDQCWRLYSGGTRFY